MTPQEAIAGKTARPYCKDCGAPYRRWNGAWRADEYCQNGHPPRGSEVFLHEVPKWLRAALNAAYPAEIRNHFRSKFYVTARRTKVGSRSEAELFLLDFINPATGCRLFDHWGRDAEDNLISEPYAATCEKCQAAARAFAERIGSNFTITPLTWWAPWIKECVRFTFCQPVLEGVQDARS